MWYLCAQMILCLLIAAILGFLIGWLLRGLFKKQVVVGDLREDDLKLVVGIGPVFEKRLREVGIKTFKQLAELTEEEIERLSEKIGPFPERIQRENWVEQAKAFHYQKYGERI
ncbi:hypothetical protein JW964_26695 [candidate division KSB1 bacterium]|nr:hypothetical protein [candidate division KSB1 bacterium]